MDRSRQEITRDYIWGNGKISRDGFVVYVYTEDLCVLHTPADDIYGAIHRQE